MSDGTFTHSALEAFLLAIRDLAAAESLRPRKGPLCVLLLQRRSRPTHAAAQPLVHLAPYSEIHSLVTRLTSVRQVRAIHRLVTFHCCNTVEIICE